MSRAQIPNSVVSVQWLKENASAENLIIFDASMKPILPVAEAAPETPSYIPGALRFDFDDVLCEHNTSLPHMLPAAELFESEMQQYGVNNDSAIVVYDKNGIYSSPRAWWMFKAFGHDQVAVLDGGLPAWTQAGYETVSTLRMPTQRGTFASHLRPGLFVDSKSVVHALSDPACGVLDARSAGRFAGQEPEPRPGLRGGHMPGAFNLPFAETQANGVLKSPALLQALFAQHEGKKLIFSCGSGVTACVLALAAEQAGFTELAVYDGSWSEWGRDDSGLPVTTA